MYLGAALPAKGVPEIAAELENIRKEIKKWTGESGHGVLVNTRNLERKDRTGRRQIYMHVLRREGPKALARMLFQQAKWRFGLR
jgi:predicted nucleotidyltransferase